MTSCLRIIISLTLARTLFIRLSWTFRLAISDRSAVASRDRGSILRESSSSEAGRSKNKNSGNSVQIKLFPPGYSHSWLHSLCRLEGIFTKMPFAQKDMLKRPYPTTRVCSVLLTCRIHRSLRRSPLGN